MSSQTDHSAAGQALGYVYQFDRATYRLLGASLDVISVGVEDLDDVSEHRSDSTVVREQDKSSVTEDGPLTNRSENLWKTLAIWVEVSRSDPEMALRTEFHLMTNGVVKKTSLAHRVHAATTLAEAEAVADEIVNIIPSLRRNLVDFGQMIGSVPREMLAQIILRISVFDRVSPEFGGALEDVPCLRHYPQQVRVSVFDQARGWISRRIRQAVSTGQVARVTREDFEREMRGIVRRITMAPLVALVKPVSPSVNFDEYNGYGFVQQLEWIDCEESEVREAIIHYVTAEDARIRWTDADLVGEDALQAYQKDLIVRWGLIYHSVGRDVWPSEERRGQECFDRTMAVDSHLDNQAMPKAVTCGTFHLLADFSPPQLPRLGWHPRYQEKATVRGGTGVE